ncbi:hypothetical protein [Actinoplanes sp. NBRC 103695]|uniref:WXG100 family type VII secretion target n=1 Tax=Actinoplanes sp. NBRC 103695 TaxID=3032202 RepID=UPI0024A5C2A6|nr:hypothetical protein [Actinoplanes sp. NBRC 103695]GLY93923.1 hypothetical protein Acsp02_11790 [Actinoplanes sp. NBRC 103695]
MAEFSVDISGLHGLHNQLLHFGDDSDEALKVVQDKADLSFYEEGLIQILKGAHQHAFDDVTGFLKDLGKICRDSASEISTVQNYYRITDAGTAKTVDASLPGAKDASTTVANPPPKNSAFATAAFSDAVDASTKITRDPSFTSASTEFQLDLLTDLSSPSAGIRAACQYAFHFDPFVIWLAWSSGEWNEYSEAAVVWGFLGDWCDAMAQNLERAAGDIPSVWTGQAAEACQEYLVTLAKAIRDVQDTMTQYQKQYAEASKAARDLFEAASGPVGLLLDKLLYISIALAGGTATIPTVIGPVLGYGAAAYFAYEAIEIYNRISSVYGNAKSAFYGISGVIGALEAGADLSKAVKQGFDHPAAN